MVKGLVNDTSLSAIGDVIREAKGEEKYLKWESDILSKPVTEQGFSMVEIPDAVYEDKKSNVEIVFDNPDNFSPVRLTLQSYYANGDKKFTTDTSIWWVGNGVYKYNSEESLYNNIRTLDTETGYIGVRLPNIEGVNILSAKILAPNTDSDILNPNTNYLPSEMAEEVNSILSTSEEYRTFTHDRCYNEQKVLKVPDTVNRIGVYDFAYSQFTEIILPQNDSLNIYGNAFMTSMQLRKIVIPENAHIVGSYLFDQCGNLKELTMMCPATNIGVSPKNGILNNSSITKLNVPSKYYQGYLETGSWPKLTSLHDTDLTELVINGSRQANLFVRPQLSYSVLYNDIDSAYDEQRGVTWSCSGKATISEDGVVTIDESAEVGDIITVTATSTYNPDISSSIDIECVYVTRTYSVDLSQWEVSDKPSPTGDTMYQSFSNLHQSNEIAKTRINLRGFNKFVLYAMYSAERNYDYIIISKLNTSMDDIPYWNSSDVWQREEVQEHFYDFDQEVYKRVEYACTGGEDFIDILYGKDGSGDQLDDRGYFYVAESECE